MAITLNSTAFEKSVATLVEALKASADSAINPKTKDPWGGPQSWFGRSRQAFQGGGNAGEWAAKRVYDALSGPAGKPGFAGPPSPAQAAQISMAESAASAVGTFASVTTAAALAVRGLVLAMDDAKASTNRLLASQEKYAEVNSAFARAYAEREFNKLTHDQRIANQTSGSVKGLIDSERDLDKGTEQIDILRQNSENLYQRFKNEVLTAILEPLDKIAGAANKLIEKLFGKSEQGMDLGQWAAESSDRAEKERKAWRDAKERLNDMVPGGGGDF